MDGYDRAFRGKRITVMGLGLLGRGVGDIAFLAKCGAHVLVTDKKTQQQLERSIAQLREFEDVRFHLGGHRIDDFTNCDMVIKAAGVPLNSPEIEAARKAGVPIAMSTALFAKHAAEAGARIVGVTGTRGKSTVSHMIFHTLQRAGRRAHLGGNVRGISTLALLPNVEANDIAVLELDSWQLQGFGELRFSPHVAVFTNLMPDHLNYYFHMDAYFEDKSHIFKYQQLNDTLIAGAGIEKRIADAHPAARLLVPHLIPAEWQLRIPGLHNRENAAFAKEALQALGLTETEIREGLESFAGVEGRLQFVRDVGGVQIYNDNNATTPEATIAALRALGSSITLIIGGSEKNLALDELVSEIHTRVSHVILLTHEQYQGSERLAAALRARGIAFYEAASITEALAEAAARTSGGYILFSPAFASFGMFKNEYERNDEFIAAVRSIA